MAPDRMSFARRMKGGLPVILALLLSLLTGNRVTPEERRAEHADLGAGIAAPVSSSASPRASHNTADAQWKTYGHPRQLGSTSTRAAPRHPSRSTHRHPRRAPGPRLGSANGPRAP